MFKIDQDNLTQNRIDEIRGFIKNWRLNEGYTQREFAKLAGLHYRSIQNIEQKGVANINSIFKIIDVMQISLSDFFSDID